VKSLRIIAICAALVAEVGAIFQPVAAVQAYHYAVLVCLQIALGALFLILMFQATGGRWGERVMPSLLAINRLVPWCFIALAPVVIFLPAVYRWAGDARIAGDRAVFLNQTFFAIRCFLYLVILGGMSLLVSRGRKPASGGLVVYALVGYFVAVDTVMAIDPRWYSSGFPVVFMTSSALMAHALAVVMTAATATTEEDRKTWRDLGNLLLTYIIFWSYVAFTQFLIIWTGNLPHEIQWYRIRGEGIWKWITIFLAVCNLFAPFFILLARSVKDRPQRLKRVAAALLVCQIIYVYWLVAPSYPHRGASGLQWLDPVFLLAVSSFFLGRVQRKLRNGVIQ
jgi:hypothetical protein